MNLPLLPVLRRRHLPLLVVALLAFVATPLSAQVGLLLFIDEAPADQTIDCFDRQDLPVSLRASRVLDGGLLDTIIVSPRDSLASGDNACTGGTLFRVWEQSGPVNTIRQRQTVTFGAPTPESAPAFTAAELPASRVEVSCTVANDNTDPASYLAWLTERRIATAEALTGSCVGPVTLTDDAPDTLPQQACRDSVVVTFTGSDSCARTAAVTFTYVTFDTEGPVINGVTTATLDLSCEEGVPPVPDVTITDCDPNATLTFNEASTRVMDGSCQQYTYEVERTWVARDGCGNATTVTRTYRVADTTVPDFIRPPDINLRCTQDPYDQDLTGRPSAITDNCNEEEQLTVSFADEVVGLGSCPNRFDVRRTWQVSDVCGNTRVRIQIIRVRDDVDPTFTPPAAVVNASCSDYENLEITGQPTNLADLCDPTVNLFYEDELITDGCSGSFTVERRFRIFDDCGNDRFFTQTINVTDTTAPVFIVAPQSLVTSCNADRRQSRLFADWLRSLQEVEVVDGCNSRDEISVEVFASGTDTFPVLPPITCMGDNGVVREVTVDVIASDPCGNSTTITVSYQQIDEQPVNIFDCQPSQVIPTDPGACAATVVLTPPTIQDQCNNADPLRLNLRDTATLTSQATSQSELGSVPVDPLIFNLPIGLDFPINGESLGELTIELDNVDAEGADEFFFIYDENDLLIGTTERSTLQCGNSVTIDSISSFQFTRWAADGVITIRLEPNVPEGRPGTFAINNLCTSASTVRLHLFMPIRRVFGIVYEVNIDDGGFQEYTPTTSLTRQLELGLHQVTYRVTDCGGTVDECTFTITVEDQQAPVVTCPENVITYLGATECQQQVLLPLPLAVTDNCEPYQVSTERFPSGHDFALFPFLFDPNLNTFQAQRITAPLTEIPGNLTDSVTLEVTFVGMFSGNSAILDVVLADGTVVGSSRRGDATCGTRGNLVINVPAADFLATLDAQGNTAVQLRPRPVTVPPGQEGDGVTPCDPENITNDGGDDGQSGAFLRVTYRTLFPGFFSEGATEIPLTTTSPGQPDAEGLFNLGSSQVSYVISDPGGNTGSCSFSVTVLDTIRPVVACQPTTVFVDPSGAGPTVADPLALAASFSDNCSVDSFYLSTPSFTCDQYGQTPNITLFVADPSGNVDSCTTLVTIAPLLPEPTATTFTCGGDTLQFFANPPTSAAPGQTLYTYAWFNPAGEMFSTRENPVITNATTDNNGTYRVVIRGITGCEATGIVGVSILRSPPAAEIAAPQRVCVGEDVTLTSTSSYVGSVRYDWYRGQPGTGEFLGSSNSASFTASFADNSDSGDFYVIAFVNGCEAPPSAVVTVGSAIQPQISVERALVTACENGPVTFRATGPASLVYEWTGPNDFLATGQSITIDALTEDNAGAYQVRGIRSGGCFSEPVAVNLLVILAAEPTTLSGPRQLCQGDTLTLMAAFPGPATYIFEGPGELSFTTTAPILRLPPLTRSRTGNWTVRVLQGSCPSLPSPAITITEGLAPQARATLIPDPVCEGNDLILQGSSNVAGSSYQWRGPGGFDEAGIAVNVDNIAADQAGDYLLTVTSPSGCSTTDTLTVDVLPGITVDSISVLSGTCLRGGEPALLVANISPTLPNGYTYSWNGPEGRSTSDTFRIPAVSLASNGNYTLAVTNEAGCVSPLRSMPIEFDFAPLAPVAPFTEDGITSTCEGDSITLLTNDFGPTATYLWRLGDGTNIPTSTNALVIDGVDADISGGFSVRVISNGCPSPPSPVREFTFTPFPAITVTANDPACTGQPINFNATDIAGAVYAWRGPNNFSSSLPNPVISNADPNVHAGLYSVVANLRGCVTDTVFVDVAVRPTPRIPVIQPLTALCTADPGAQLDLVINPNTATPGAVYQFSTQRGLTPIGDPTSDGSLAVTDFSFFRGDGVYRFQVQATVDGCTSELSANANVRIVSPGDLTPDAGRDTVLCSGMHVLTAGPVDRGSGQWSLVAGGGDIEIMSPTERTTVVTGLTEFGGPYQFAWTLSNETCVNYAADTVTVSITDGEDAVAGDNIIACLRDETRLSASPVTMPGSGGRWTQALAQELLGVTIVSPTDPNTRIEGLQADNTYSFTWTVTSNCGVKEDIVLLNVSDPSPFAGADDTVCNDERSTVLMADEPTEGSLGQWRSLDGEITFTDRLSAVTPVIGLRPGANRFVWEVDDAICGDRARDTVIINYAASPNPQDDEYDVAFQGEITFDPTENDNLPDDFDVSFTDPPMGASLVRNDDGTFTFRGPDNFVGELAVAYRVTGMGCNEAIATVFFLVGKDVDCVPPNIFTPNGDGMNDFFVVPCLLDTDRFPESQVTIYNQWGDEVFRSGKPYTSDWDGTFQGRELPVATYFYTIDFGGAQEGATGSVRIER